ADVASIFLLSSSRVMSDLLLRRRWAAAGMARCFRIMSSAPFIARQREIHELALPCRSQMGEHVRAPQAPRQAGQRAQVAVDACRRTGKHRHDVGAAAASSVEIERMPKAGD